jgi:structural maintenance of chromosome 1
MGRLQQLEVENFKSYEGKQLVGPFDNFTCIIGPNGAGKSNMMDAISFVLGVQSRHLRSSHLKELVFRKDASSAPARRASVKLIYRLSEGEVDNSNEGDEISFCRIITAAGVGSYKLNNKDVSFERYEETLNKIGVLVKARNFLVFQGDIESVASKSPQDLTKLLEQISGSDQYATEYEELLRLRSAAEENTIFSMQKKKMFSTQCREVKGQKDEAEYFQEKQEELAEERTEHVLFQIWCVKSEMEGKQDSADELREQLAVVKANEEEVDADMETQKREFAIASKSLVQAEKGLTTAVTKLDAVTPKLLETRAKLKSVQKRLADQDKSKARVQADLQEQADTVAGLQSDIADLEAAEADLKAQLEATTDSELKLNPADVKEYSKLREEVSRQIATERSQELTMDLDLKSKQELQKRLQAQEEAQGAEEAAGDRLLTECMQRREVLTGAVRTCQAEQTALLASRETLGTLCCCVCAMYRFYIPKLFTKAENTRVIHVSLLDAFTREFCCG